MLKHVSMFGCGVLGLMLLASSAALAQGKGGGRQGGASGGKGGFGSAGAKSGRSTGFAGGKSAAGGGQCAAQAATGTATAAAATTSTQTQATGLVRQQQAYLQNLLGLASQQTDSTLQNALRNSSAAVRWAASQELSRRRQNQ
jgi:hypothetical protein